MASSNRHWPSMFKSKPSTTHHQWHHDINSSTPPNCTRTTPYTPGSGCEERTPEPKPRWNPRPEQIRILEAIFNSGMVNPPRDEIRKIRAQLQEYGQVGDANVFYWFQNRKSRSKHKQRHLKSQQTTATPTHPSATNNFITAPSSSSSSSDKSSPNNSTDKKSLSVCPATVIDLLNSNSPTASVNQPFFQSSSDYLAEPFFFPVSGSGGGGGGSGSAAATVMSTQGFCFPDVGPDQSGVGNVPSFLLSELMLMGHCASSKKDEEDHDKIKLQQHLSYGVPSAPKPVSPASFSVPSPYTHLLQGAGGGEQGGPTKSTVFINDVCFEVGFGPFSVREAFGDDVVLIQSSGQPVLTDEWGMTLQPLQHGGFYYLSRPFTASPDDRTIDLI